ncbi:MAG: L,D-transpeptidase family protein [Dissulfurimicrobium sp.]|uniref:L,D-transpeptidase family protein n=1 Tax=Dissulfurimicrobium TaxID=1769732 RepID=UPI003C73659A
MRLFFIFTLINIFVPRYAFASTCLVIDKARKTLTVLKDKRPAVKVHVSLGIDPDSDKYKVNDAATPEGLYFITYKKPKSRFHRFLGISYPNLINAIRALMGGVISPEEYKKIYTAIKKSEAVPCDTGLGCGIGIHGGGIYRLFDGVPEADWTEGCVALNDKDIDQIFPLVRPNDTVIILNSRRNLYGVIRPFASIIETDKSGFPVCPDGVCTFETGLKTSMGRMLIEIKEGRDGNRSLKVMVFDENGKGPENEPILVLTDQNADGRIGPGDTATGPLAQGKDPQAIYDLIRKVVIDALHKGDIIRHY